MIQRGEINVSYCEHYAQWALTTYLLVVWPLLLFPPCVIPFSKLCCLLSLLFLLFSLSLLSCLPPLISLILFIWRKDALLVNRAFVKRILNGTLIERKKLPLSAILNSWVRAATVPVWDSHERFTKCVSANTNDRKRPSINFWISQMGQSLI